MEKDKPHIFEDRTKFEEDTAINFDEVKTILKIRVNELLDINPKMFIGFDSQDLMFEMSEQRIKRVEKIFAVYKSMFNKYKEEAKNYNITPICQTDKKDVF